MKTLEMTVAAALACALATGCSDEGSDPVCEEAPGIACTWLGIPGEEGFNGDGRHRLDTRLYWTMDMLFARDGTAWFVDWNNHLVRKVLPDDTVQTVVGWTDPILPGDGEPSGAELRPEGAVGTEVRLNHPTEFAQLSDGTILLMAWHNHKLRSIDPDTGRTRILAGGGAGFSGDDGPAASALLKQPKSLCLDDGDLVYVGDQQELSRADHRRCGDHSHHRRQRRRQSGRRAGSRQHPRARLAHRLGSGLQPGAVRRHRRRRSHHVSGPRPCATAFASSTFPRD